MLCYNKNGSLLRAGGNTHLFWFPSSTPLLLTTARQTPQGGEDKQILQFFHRDMRSLRSARDDLDRFYAGYLMGSPSGYILITSAGTS